MGELRVTSPNAMIGKAIGEISSLTGDVFILAGFSCEFPPGDFAKLSDHIVAFDRVSDRLAKVKFGGHEFGAILDELDDRLLTLEIHGQSTIALIRQLRDDAYQGTLELGVQLN
ncbi:MAG: hypothetical protein AAF950_17175 [Pseudomonadota bacterium]